MIDLDKFKNYLGNLSEKEKDELREYFSDKRPKGWLDIEEYLPMMFAKDIAQGYSFLRLNILMVLKVNQKLPTTILGIIMQKKLV